MMKKSNPVPPREVDVMTREEAMEIIKKENLKYYNLFGQHLCLSPQVIWKKLENIF